MVEVEKWRDDKVRSAEIEMYIKIRFCTGCGTGGHESFGDAKINRVFNQVQGELKLIFLDKSLLIKTFSDTRS